MVRGPYKKEIQNFTIRPVMLLGIGFQMKRRIEEKIFIINKAKTPWLKRHQQNYIRFKNDPILIENLEILQHCSTKSIKRNKKHLISYLLNCYSDWATAYDAFVFYDEILHPNLDAIDKEELLSFDFTALIEDKFINSKTFQEKNRKKCPQYCIDLHIFPGATKRETLRFIDENWDILQLASTTGKIKPRFKKEFAKKTIIRYLTYYLKPSDVAKIINKFYENYETDDPEIYAESSEIKKQKRLDWFSEARKEFSYYIYQDRMKFLSHRKNDLVEKSISKLRKLNALNDKEIDFGLDLVFDLENKKFHLNKR